MFDSIGNRMKGYEYVPRINLIRKLPVMMRLDGKAFHTVCRGLKKPWDEDFVACMDSAAIAVCKEIQGARMAYVQSDEISILVVDYDTIKTEAWFDNQVMKMVSISASVCTSAFQEEFQKRFPDRWKRGTRPVFDSRVWNLPPHEVVNAFIWRQQDAVRNSIASLGQAHFSPKQMHGKHSDEIQEMLFSEKGINWNDTPTRFKRGRCIMKLSRQVSTPKGNAVRNSWQVINEIPTFSTPEGRVLIEDLLKPRGEIVP